MKIVEMDGDLRKRLIATEEDVLTPMVRHIAPPPSCSRCKKEMVACRPENLVGIIASYDYKCSSCNQGVSASGIVT